MSYYKIYREPALPKECALWQQFFFRVATMWISVQHVSRLVYGFITWASVKVGQDIRSTK